MNKWKKAISTGMSAALVASLFTFIAASTVLGSTSVTSAGNVPQGGTSAGTATFAFTEKSVAALTNAGGNFTVYIFDSGSSCANTVVGNAAFATVHFTGTATQSGPDSLGLKPIIVGDNFFTITTTDADNVNIESITVSGLSIKADTTAATGAIKACVYNDSGIFAAAFGTAVKAEGTLSTGYAAGTTSIVVNVSTTACIFAVTVGSDPDNLSFATSPETKAITAASALGVPGPNQQTLTIAATANNHNLGEAVSQANSACGASTALGSPGTVVKSLRYLLPDQTRVNPGETNQSVANLSAKERDNVIPDGPAWTASFFSVGGTLTLTITTPGVTFSQAPRATATNGLLFNTTPSGGAASVYGTLSADRQSATWTVNAKSTAASVITWSNIFYDVAASVAPGTAVNVTLASSDGVVAPSSRSNAIVGRVLNVTSTAPVVYIGENNQTAGQITITETGAGFFQSGTGSNNTFVACIIFDGFSNSQFAAAPWAKVTAGDLRLREGTTASSDNVVQGTPITVAGFPFACYYWTVWTASTTASTVVISGDEAGTAGVKLNVPAGDAIGPVTASIRTGDITGGTFNMILEARTVIAVKQFRNQVLVTALSQPTIPPGSNGSPAGDIQIQETANGQLKTGETICVQIVPNQNWNTLFDAYLKGLNTADLPIVTGSNGIIPTAVSTSLRSCNGQDILVGGFGGGLVESFTFNISQQSISGNGKLVISNLHYATVNDAVTGPVQVMVDGYSGSNTQIQFQSLISNAKIGSVLAGTAASRLGVTQVGAFTTSTKVQKVGKYVTFRFDFGVGAAGAHVDIWAATKTGNDWTGFSKVTSRVANASGVVYYYVRQSSATWKSYRAAWGGGGVMTPARQARWIP